MTAVQQAAEARATIARAAGLPDPRFWISWGEGVLIANDMTEVDHGRIVAVFQHTLGAWEERASALTWLVEERS